MHAVEALIAGIAGAENGHAELYVRGSSTRAAWFSDFEAESQNSSGSDITLDGNGGAVVYVNRLVDVIVKDEDGATVRQFVAGAGAAAVEVISQSFTGTDYETGQSGASKPTNLGSVLDLWYESAGAVDWKVLSGGQALTLVAILGGLAGLVFNVKSAPYGALGDAAANDTAAIQAAMDAAAAAGGWVFFPPGRYRTEAAITWEENVSIIGCGATCTSVEIDHATANVFTSSGSSVAGARFMVGLHLTAFASNTGRLVALTNASASNTHIIGCRLGGSNALGDCVEVSSAAHRVLLSGCRLELLTTSTACAIDATNATATGRIQVSNCTFVVPVDYTSNLTQISCHAQFSNCFFDLSANTTGTNQLFVNTDANGTLTVTGCRFVIGTGTTRGFIWQAGAVLVESGNSWSAPASTWEIFDTTSPPALGNGTHLGSRLGRKKTYTSDAATLAIDALNYGVVEIVRTADSAMAAELSTAYVGAELQFGVSWTAAAGSSATIAFTGSAHSVKTGVGFNPPDANERGTFAKAFLVEHAGTKYWIMGEPTEEYGL